MNFKKIKATVNTPKLLLIRHGATDLNGSGGVSEDRIRGHLNIPLNNVGIKDAIRARKELSSYNPDVFYCSDLIRAKQTCAVCHDDWPNAPVIYSSDLRPWNLGSLQGQKTSDVADEMNQLTKNDTEAPEGGESFATFRNKYLSKLKNIADTALKRNLEVVVFTHLRNLIVAHAWAAAGFPDDFTIDNESMTSNKYEPGDIVEWPLDQYKKRGSNVSG